MIALCGEAGLPEPEFCQEGGQFVMTMWRDWLTDEVISQMNLNERQLETLAIARSEGRLTNSRYQEVTGASRATAKRDLADMVSKDILVARGAGRGAYYEVRRKRVENGSNGSSTR